VSLCLTKHHTRKAYWGSVGIALRILVLGTKLKWVVSFTPQPLYPQGKSPLYPLVRRLGGLTRIVGFPITGNNKHSIIIIIIIIIIPFGRWISVSCISLSISLLSRNQHCTDGDVTCFSRIRSHWSTVTLVHVLYWSQDNIYSFSQFERPLIWYPIKFFITLA
jgi:hypothetical protein